MFTFNHTVYIYIPCVFLSEPPQKPLGLSISCSGNSVELFWSPGSDGGSTITHYLVQFNTSDNPNIWHYYNENIPGDEVMTRVNLSPWLIYNFRLLAKNDVGFSEPSEPTKQQCITPPERPSSNPKNVHTLTHKMGKLIVTWTVSMEHFTFCLKQIVEDFFKVNKDETLNKMFKCLFTKLVRFLLNNGKTTKCMFSFYSCLQSLLKFIVRLSYFSLVNSSANETSSSQRTWI